MPCRPWYSLPVFHVFHKTSKKDAEIATCTFCNSLFITESFPIRYLSLWSHTDRLSLNATSSTSGTWQQTCYGRNSHQHSLIGPRESPRGDSSEKTPVFFSISPKQITEFILAALIVTSQLVLCFKFYFSISKQPQTTVSQYHTH